MVRHKVPLPDLGFYKPVEVYDSAYGMGSTEMREDFAIMTEKKAELTAVLLHAVTIAKGGTVEAHAASVPRAGGAKPVPALPVKVDKIVAECQYDYVGQQADELSFKLGDMIDLEDDR